MTGTPQSANAIEVFFSYAHKDERMREQLERHLAILKHEGVISSWHDRQIGAGEEWAGKITEHINSADLILLLVSADFLASDYCYDVEMTRAMERHDANEARVIPVILRPCAWQTSPFGKLQALPKDAKPVTTWERRDDAFLTVEKGIREALRRHAAGPASSILITKDPFSPVAPPALRQLRAPVADFVGRAEEIERLTKALGQSDKASATGPVCVVRGMGGLGKTELAYKVAEWIESEFPDGQLLIELRGESPSPLSPEQALQNIILTFDRNAKLPDNLSGTQAMYQSTLTGKRLLILADNAKGAEQVRSLLPPNGCALLLTSRQRFALPGMMAVDLDNLPADAAEQLLRQICPRVGDAAHRLAQMCGFLPLALRVSASVLASDDTLRVERYLDRLTNEIDRLKLLHDPDDPDFDVEASLRQSYDALESEAQSTLCQISVFPGSFDLMAVAKVMPPLGTADVEEMLSLLRRRSLIDWDEEEQRYRLHDLVRVFAATRLKDPSELRRRHALYYARLVTSVIQFDKPINDANKDSLSADISAEPIEVFAREWANIDAGWRWAQEHAGDSEADALLLDYATMWSELTYETPTELLSASLAAAQRQGHREVEMTILRQLGDVFLYPDTTQSIEHYRLALEIAKEFVNGVAEGTILINIGIAYSVRKETAREIEFYEKALTALSKEGHRWLEGSALIDLGNANTGLRERCLYEALSSNTIHTFGDEPTELLDTGKAIEFFEQALLIWRELAEKDAETSTLAYLGFAHERMGELSQARKYYEQAVTLTETSSRRSFPLRALAELLFNQEEYSEAQPYTEQLLMIARTQNDRSLEGEMLYMMSHIASKHGNAQQAFAYAEEALPIAQELENRQTEGVILGWLGDFSAEIAGADQAIAYYEQSLAIARELNDQDRAELLLCELGSNYSLLKRYDEALAAVQESISLNSSSSLAFSKYVELGNVFVGLYRYGDARDAYQQALRLSADASAKASITGILGNLLFEQGRFDEALAAYQAAADIDSGSAEAHIQLSQILNVLGRYDEALTASQRARDIDPTNVGPLITQAGVYRKQGRTADFETCLADARKLIAKASEYTRANFASVCGDVEGGLKLLKAALEKNEQSRAWAKHDPDFEFIRDDSRFKALVME